MSTHIDPDIKMLRNRELIEITNGIMTGIDSKYDFSVYKLQETFARDRKEAETVACHIVNRRLINLLTRKLIIFTRQEVEIQEFLEEKGDSMIEKWFEQIEKAFEEEAKIKSEIFVLYSSLYHQISDQIFNGFRNLAMDTASKEREV